MIKIIYNLKKVFNNKRNIAFIILVIAINLVGVLYIGLKKENEAFFDQSSILNDRWITLNKNDSIYNDYYFYSEDSKLSSVSVFVQNKDTIDTAQIEASVLDSNNNIICKKIYEIDQGESFIDLKLPSTKTDNIMDLRIMVKNISSNENVQTRIVDGGDINDIENARVAFQVYSTMPSFVTIYIILCFILVNVILVSGYYLIFIKKYNIEKIFICIIFLFGFFYIVTFTPGNIPDDSTHIRNTLGYSSILLSKGSKDNAVIRECEQFMGDNQPSVKTLNAYRKAIIENDNSNVYIDTGIELSGGFLAYLPGTICVTICRMLNIGGILTIYLARITNLLCYSFAGYFAIKKIPIAKVALFTLSLLPMVIHQCSSLSYDTIIIASSWIVIAYGFYFVYGTDKIRKKDIVLYIFFSSVLVTQKAGIYLFVNLIPLLIGKNRINDKKDRLILKIILTIPWLSVLIVPSVISNSSDIQNVSSQGNVVGWANQEAYSFNYFLNHKVDTIILFGRTIVKKFEHYVFSALGQYLGSLNLNLSRNIFVLWLMAIFTSGFKYKDEKGEILKFHKIIYALIFVIVCGACMLAMAFAFTPIGWPTIEGVQGRYFLPVLILLILIIRNKKIQFSNVWKNDFLMSVIILHCVTVINIVGTLISV